MATAPIPRATRRSAAPWRCWSNYSIVPRSIHRGPTTAARTPTTTTAGRRRPSSRWNDVAPRSGVVARRIPPSPTRDALLHGGQPLGEPWLLCAPQLRHEFTLDRRRMVVDVRHVEDRLLGANRQFAWRRGGARGELVGDVEQRLARHRLVGQTDPFGLHAVQH